ncbi:MAG: VCBS repeat-containing protein [Cyclobacteriaceae bacterium]
MKSLAFRYFLLSFLLATMVACDVESKRFRSLTDSESGVDFVNELKPTEDLNILTYLYYYNGAGVAVADYNQDGFSDLYFTSNQGADQLYLNKGNLKFENVTSKTGIENSNGWTTGVTHIDINGDGLLDIYVCKVGKYKSITGYNLLFVNQGNSADGTPMFKESAREYGLDLVTFSTQAAFFDYDLDGDLDLYVMSHSVHPNHSYGRGDTRQSIDSLAGDRLFENVNGLFTDVSKVAGIFQAKIGYGLGLSIGDLNQDGYPDIYVGNDFFENDYLYQNNGDKTFTELNSKDLRVLGHTTHYSMGNSIADINNDGKSDIMSLDMLPEDLKTLKSSGVEDEYPIYNTFLENGYAPQYMQNTLHLNRGNGIFSEVGFQSGIAATEWSWGILAADYDLDGFKDIYITNGILGATNDMDYINFVSQDLIQQSIGQNFQRQSLDFAKYIPEKRVSNYMFQNIGGTSFKEVTKEWFNAKPSLSNGGAYADLDNDGDLDIVVNNVNEKAFVFQNLTSDKDDGNYLTIGFKGDRGNAFGIGAKVEVFAGDLYAFEENFPVKSYLSAVPNEVFFGLADNKTVDSIRVIWPSNKEQLLRNIDSNQKIIVDINEATQVPINSSKGRTESLIVNVDQLLDFEHREESTLDFDRDPLVPFAVSNEGPSISVGDINGDLLDDIFIGGAKLQSSQLFVQSPNGSFRTSQLELFESDARSEDVDQVFFDADNDSDLDLLVVSGGNEFVNGDPLKPRLYINNDGKFSYAKEEFKDIVINASGVKSIDLDKDGDQDIVIVSNVLPREFGESAKNLIFSNDGKGHFTDVTESFSASFRDAGLITDLKVVDIDKNGYDDIVAVGTWMPVTIFTNNGSTLSSKPILNSEGWWNSIAIDDFDKDGDIDLVAGNWGNNTRLKASDKQPVTLYRSDFDGNGNTETLITYFYQGEETFMSSMDGLAKQMPFIRKKYLSYHDFANASVAEVMGAEKLSNAVQKKARTLSTTYFRNEGNGSFKAIELPAAAQQSTANAIAVDDFNHDGYNDLLLVGNNYEISTQLGRLDASHGVLLLNDRNGFFVETKDQSFNVAGAARDIKKIRIGAEDYYIVAMNNDKPIFLKKQEKQ